MSQLKQANGKPVFALSQPIEKLSIAVDESDPRKDESKSFSANQMAKIRGRRGKIQAAYRYYDSFAIGSIVSDWTVAL